MKKLLILASVGEAAFGLLLFILPSLVARLLLATSVSRGAVTVGRFAGAGLVGLGIICWPRGDARGEFYIMLVWSVVAAASLVVVDLRWSAGVLLWPAVVAHGVISLLLWTNRPGRDAI